MSEIVNKGKFSVTQTSKEAQPQRCSSVTEEGVEGATGGSGSENLSSLSMQSLSQPDSGFIQTLVQLGGSQVSP